MKKLLIAVTGALLLGTPPAPAAQGGSKGKAYKTPQEVFDAFHAAANKDDWKTALACVTIEIPVDRYVPA